MEYYAFETKEACEVALSIMHAEMLAIASSFGYPVADGAMLGVRSGSGDIVQSVRIDRWSDPIPASDGKWLIPSCRGRFPTTHARIEARAGLPEPMECTPAADGE